MRKILEWPLLIVLNIIVSIKGFIEYFRVVWRYYGNAEFRATDLSIIKAYLFRSPYRVHKQFLKERGEKDIYTYGETYLTSLDTLATAADIQSSDTYVELGCGRARTCFWMHALKNCKVIGIDYVPAFIQKAQAVVEKYKLQDIHFACQDFINDKLPKGTVYYIDATLSEGGEIAAIIRQFDKLPVGVKVITVNMSLTGDFHRQRPQWKELATLSVNFPWGIADAAVFEKTS